MFKIGEFSKLMQVSVRMLRYYDQNGLLKPDRVDHYTGYRFYSAGQIADLQKIIYLRDIGYTVCEIAKAQQNWDGNFLSNQLKDKQQEIQDDIDQAQKKLKSIETALSGIQNEKIVLRHDYIVKKIPSYEVISLRQIIPDYFCEGQLWEKLGALMTLNRISRPRVACDIAIYHDADFKDKNVDVEVCSALDCTDYSEHFEDTAGLKGGLNYRKIEAVDQMACTMVYGPFENISGAYQSFAHWLSMRNSYKMVGRNRQICHRGPWNEENPNQYLTEIQIPIKEIKKGASSWVSDSVNTP